MLTVVYRALPQSPGGFGFAALPAPEHGPAGAVPLAGYVAATTSVGRLFVQMGTQRLRELLPPLLRRYARQPALAVRSAQTVLYPLLVREEHAPGAAASAELLSIMVEPALRSHGIGALLVEALLQECRNRSLGSIVVTVDAANGGAQRFYARHGFGPWRTITLNRRPMWVLQRML